MKKELLRKLFHLLELPIVGGYLLIAEYYDKRIALLALTLVLTVLLIVEFVRLESGIKTPLIDNILRQKEKDNMAASIFFILSTIVLFAVFETMIAVTALVMATVGDLMSAIIGKAYGKKKLYKNKTYAGTIAGLVANLLIAIYLLPGLTYVAISMAITATVTELLSIKIDDNLTVPVFSGFIGQLILELPRHLI